MKQFSMADENILCDTPECRAEVRRLSAYERLAAATSPPVETVICVVEGQMLVEVDGASFLLTAMQGVQLPAGQAWTASALADGAKILSVASFHPTFTQGRALMAPLAQPQRFAVAADQWLVYTDYVRGGVLNFAPHFVADKHFHQAADEIFWFFQGTCRVTTSTGAVDCPAGTIIYTPAGEWHVIENMGDEPLLMFLTVTPNIVPSHTFFDVNGAPFVRSWAPLRRPN